MHHEARTHRVDLDGGVLLLDPRALSKHVNTTQQSADMLTKKKQFTISATAASSSWATGSHNRSVGKFILYRTDGKKNVRNVDDPAKSDGLRNQERRHLHDGDAQHLCKIWERSHTHLCDFREPGRK